MFEAETLNSQLFLTRVFQSLASANTRKIVELLAQGPRSHAELLQVMDSTDSRIRAAMLVLHTVGLVSEGRDREGETVYLFNQSGLGIARSWLDRVDTMAGRPSQS
jgi:hypothetical protein